MAGQDQATEERGHAIARVALALVLVALGCYILQDFIRSLLWAAILAVAVAPLYERVHRRVRPRGHDIVLPLLFSTITTLVVVVPLALLLVQLGHEARGATAWLQDVRAHGLPPPEWLERLPFLREQAIAWWQQNLADPEGTRALLGRVGRADALSMGRQVGSALIHRAVQFGFAVLALFFLLRDGRTLGAQMLTACRRLFGPHGEPIARQIVSSIHGTVNGLVLVAVGEGVVLGIFFAIAGAPHPALLGGATAIAAVIPMGAPVVIALGAALVLAAGHSVAAIALLAAGLALIFVADHTIRPSLIGGATRLPFLWVLLGILGGVETFGLLGLFLGPAVMAALILLWREWTGDASTVRSA